MGIIKDYIEYLQDNPKHYWFKRKLYGWGWDPATWQGWLVVAVFIALVALNAIRIDSTSHSVADTLHNFIPQTTVMMLVLIAICYKTGERPKWTWGLKDKK